MPIENELDRQQTATTAAAGTAQTAGAAQTTDAPLAGNTVPAAVRTPLGGIAAEDRTQAINAMYDANIAARRADIEEQGAQALSDAQANRDRIADIYNQQRNASEVDWERQRRNFLEGAATSGINTGAGSQAELSMMGQQQRSQTRLGAEQANAEVQADRNIADISRNTQAQIGQAVAQNDYQRAAALLDEYQNTYNRAMDRAGAMAQFGDFSGYAAVYGEEAAQQMFYSWAAQNPQLAYNTGAITQDQYNNLISGRPINATGPAMNMGGGGGNNWAYTQREQYAQLLNRLANTPDAEAEFNNAREEANHMAALYGF